MIDPSILALLPTSDQMQYSLEGWFGLFERTLTILGILGVGLHQFFANREAKNHLKEQDAKLDVVHKIVNSERTGYAGKLAVALSRIAEKDPSVANVEEAHAAKVIYENILTATKVQADVTARAERDAGQPMPPPAPTGPDPLIEAEPRKKLPH